MSGTKDGNKDLGWINSWFHNPPDEVVKCRALGHRMTEITHDKSMRGHDTESRCEICAIHYHTDSSD